MTNEAVARCPGCMAGLADPSVPECPRCGYVDGADYDPDYLRPGATLSNGRYFVGVLTAQNGEGATYLGFDNKDRQTCWIREYFPTVLAARDRATGDVHPVKSYGAQYKALMSDFADTVGDVRRFAMTERVLPVLDSFAENRTYYAVYARLKLLTLEEFVTRAGGSLPMDEAMTLLAPLFNTVGEIHDHGFIHRGISPYTVYVGEEGEIYLWGFCLGAARTFGSELDAELFNGYSAPEQYSPSGWQGTWTDVYALAALVYRTVSGFVPPKSTLIGDARPLSKLSELSSGIPERISEAVAAAMNRETEGRTQSAYALLTSLVGAKTSNTAVFDTRRHLREQELMRQRERRARQDNQSGGFKYTLIALLFTVAALFCGGLYLTRTFFPAMIGGGSSESQSSSTVPSDLTSTLEEESSEPPRVENVPHFVGETLAYVEGSAEYSAQFDFTVERDFSSDFPAGVIFAQSPEEHTAVSEGRTAVTLYVSDGPKMATMPDVMGMQLEEALRVLGEQDLSFDTIDRYVVGAEENSVVGTTPEAGTEFDPNKVGIILYIMPVEEVSQPSSQSRRPSSSEDDRSSSAIRIRD